LIPKGVSYTLIDMTNGVDLNKGIPYPESSFDYVVAIDIVGHVENSWKLLSNIKKVIKPNGLAVISIQKGEEHTRCSENDISSLFEIIGKRGYIGGKFPFMCRVPFSMASEIFYLVRG